MNIFISRMIISALFMFGITARASTTFSKGISEIEGALCAILKLLVVNEKSNDDTKFLDDSSLLKAHSPEGEYVRLKIELLQAVHSISGNAKVRKFDQILNPYEL